MANTKHTPGPWENDNGLIYGRYKDGKRSFDIFDADIWPGLEDEGKANARLIAGALDLLNALELALPLVKAMNVPAVEKIVMDAISKATGAA